MKNRGKSKNIEKANLILEQSYLKSKGLLKEEPKNLITESQIEQVAEKIANDPKVQSALEEKLKNLTPEQIKKLQQDVQNTISNLKNEAKKDNMSSMSSDYMNDSENKIEKTAEVVEDLASGLAGSLLVPIIPIAIGSVIGSVALGFGVFGLGVTALYGIAKLLKKMVK
jgi:paraquat-inducible protein B